MIRKASLPAWSLPLLAMSVALAVFCGVLKNGFVWDDLLFLRENPTMRDIGNIPRFFVSGDTVGTYAATPYYRPVTATTFALDTFIWGDRPAGFHGTNLALHLAACALLFGIAFRFTGSPAASFFASLLFAVHPAQLEPVAYISARADLLCAVFMLLAFRFHLSAETGGGNAYRAASWAAAALAIFSKIPGGLLPALIAAHLLVSGRREGIFRKLAPYLAIVALFLLAREHAVVLASQREAPFPARIANMGPILQGYLRMALLPGRPNVFHGTPFVASLLDFRSIRAWAVVLTIAALSFLLARRRNPSIRFGLAWFILGLAPVSGLVILLYPTLTADRYLYIPLAGIAIALSGVLKEILALPSVRKTVFASLTMVFISFAADSFGNVAVWRDSLSLWTRAAEFAPGNPYVLNNLGAALKNEGRLDEAEQVLRQAIAAMDNASGPFINLAAVAFARNDLRTAERYAAAALQREGNNPIALNYMGVASARLGRPEDAFNYFTIAIRVWPEYEIAKANMRRLRSGFGAPGALSPIAPSREGGGS